MTELEPETILRNALSWANHVRSRQGKSELDVLPFGVPRSPLLCPLAKAMGLTMGYLERPPSAIAFMRAFDAGDFPELVARTTSERAAA